MNPGALVVVHLSQPNEKLWGVLERLGIEGVTVRGISLDSFDEWVRGVARGEAAVGLSTVFLPLYRVQRMYLDEQVGEVESYGQRFQRIVGTSVESHLG